MAAALPDPDGGNKPWIESFVYDANGNRIARHTEFKRGDTAIAHAVRYAYDALDQAIEIAIDDHAPIAIERDATGQIIRERLSPHLRREVDYSADGYLTRQRIRTDADTVVDLAYDYDAAGNLTERRDARFGIDRYVYDPVGRITQHLDPHGQVKHYLNDPAGDRLTTRIVEHEAAQAGTPDAQGEWSREGEYEGAFYRFDRAGNLIERHDRRGALHLRWDANQRLIESRLEGVSTRYRYDPLGRRIEKRSGDTITTFVWDGDALVGDWIEDPTDPVVPAKGMAREWVYYPETFEPLALLGGRSGPNTLLHYHNDPNGCPIRLTDSKGEILWAASYTAWGQIARLHVGYVDNPIRLQGQYEDGETGLHYNRHRYFDPTVGVFSSADPMGLQPSENEFLFAPNAIGWIDPLGLTCMVTKRLRYYRNQARQIVMSHPNHMMTPRQQAALARLRAAGLHGRAAGLERAFIGNRMDVTFRQLVTADPTLMARIRMTPIGRFGPDAVSTTSGRWWDLTTRRAWPAHVARYGPGGRGVFWD